MGIADYDCGWHLGRIIRNILRIEKRDRLLLRIPLLFEFYAEADGTRRKEGS